MPTHADLNRPSALAAQFLPPFLCLWPLLSRNDAMLYAGALASVLVILASLASLAIRLSRPRERRGRLLRAVMAIVLACVALFYFHSERKLVVLRMDSLATGLQLHCRQYGSCALAVGGWDKGEAPYASSIVDEQGRVAHRYLYWADRNAFEIRLDIGAGFSEKVSGGRHVKLQKATALPSLQRSMPP